MGMERDSPEPTLDLEQPEYAGRSFSHSNLSEFGFWGQGDFQIRVQNQRHLRPSSFYLQLPDTQSSFSWR